MSISNGNTNIPGEEWQPRCWTTGEFLRARREARRCSIGEVEQEVASGGHGCLDTTLAELEEGSALSLPDAWRLTLALETDFEILGAIAAGDTSMEICQVCGCTYSDPCTDALGKSCGWADEHGLLCTACAKTGGAA